MSPPGSGEAGGDREVVRRIVRIRGRVQGVGYRMSAADAAARLGVAGTVRNLLDGTVEADVEGAPAAVEAMLEALRQGPSSARVESVEARPEAPRGAGTFRITG